MKRLAVMMFVLMLSGCASNLMVQRADQQAKPVPAGKSEVVFMRSSFVGSAIQASVFDVTSDKTVLIGIISNGTKISYVTEPGERTFMVVSEAADFMKATLSPNKTYYAMVTPRFGAFRARFSFAPIRQQSADGFNVNSKEFANWVSSTRFVENTAESLKWFDDNRDDILSKKNKYWPEWQNKPANDRASQTLDARDGK